MAMTNSDGFLKSVQEIVAGFPVRALQLYAPREDTIELFERFIEETVAPLGITHVTVCLYYRFAYKSHPELVEYPCTTVEVAQRVAAVCRKHGITVVPELDVPGHQSDILREGVPMVARGMIRVHPEMMEPYTEGNSTYSVCMKHPLLRPIVYDMIDDLMEAFDTKTVHVGFDEVLDIARCPRCRDFPPYQLLAELANDLCAHIKSRGGEMWMWGDRLLDGTRFPTANAGYETSLNNTASAIDLIDPDVVICDWHYNPEPMGHLTPSYWATKSFRFLSSAFNSVLGCEQLVRATHVVSDVPNAYGIYLTTWANLADFVRLVEEKIPEYQKTGIIHHNENEVTSESTSSHKFADQSSNVFLKMFVPEKA